MTEVNNIPHASSVPIDFAKFMIGINISVEQLLINDVLSTNQTTL